MTAERIDAAALKSYVARIMRAHGVDGDQVRSVAENLIWSELVGRANFGVLRLPVLLKRVRSGVLRCPCRPTFEGLSDSVERLDGDDGFGQHLGELAMRRAVELAGTTGVGVVGVRDANFFGAGAYFVQLAAEAGALGLAMSNSFPKVIAHGGLHPVLGTNPFAFGAPRRNGRSLLIDMATSALAGSTVREHIARGEPLPVGLAVGPDGTPITDPAKVAEGGLLPFGGAKGYGLALLVEMLAGVLTGAGVSHGVASMYQNFSESGHNGLFMMALDISRWMPLPAYFERFESLIRELEASNPGGEVLLPGAIRWRSFDHNSQHGVPLDEDVRRSLEVLSRPHGIAPPWQIASVPVESFVD